jgi:transposase-like protein
MATKKKLPETLVEAVRYFSDLDVCTEFVAKLRWPEGPVCPECQGREHSYLTTRRVWKCKSCKKQFSVKKGTIFEDSPIPLDKWLVAIWMVANCKNGISSLELSRTVGLTQKSAWFVLHRIRLAMQIGSFEKYVDKFDGAVEVDETLIGGKARNLKLARRRELAKSNVKIGPRTGKTAVMGFRQRDGQIAVTVIDNIKKDALQKEVRRRVKSGATVISDELGSYRGLDQHYEHLVINHAEKYVDGQVHTNGIENFWSLLKRGLGGTYISVRPFHLFRYLDEQVYRYNNREDADLERLNGVLENIAGKRVTYRELTGKESRQPKPPKPEPRKPRAYPMGPF